MLENYIEQLMLRHVTYLTFLQIQWLTALMMHFDSTLGDQGFESKPKENAGLNPG